MWQLPPAQLTEADGAVRRCPLASQPAYRQHIGLLTVLTHEFRILFSHLDNLHLSFNKYELTENNVLYYDTASLIVIINMMF